MINDLFKENIIKKELSVNNVRQSLNAKGYNDIDLCHYYISGFESVGKSFKSDLRYDDKNASMTTSWSNTGNVQISDFGYKTGMNIFGYIQEKNYSSDAKGFVMALDRVCIDFKLDDIIPYYYRDSSYKPPKLPSKLNIETQLRSEVTILKKARHFTDLDKAYWLQFGITLEQLKVKGIQSIKRFQIINPNKNGNMLIQIKETELAYSYPERFNGKIVFKIYLPLGLHGDKGFKWFSNVPNDVIFNLRFTKDNDLLIIQSSYKDCMVMENYGYNSLPLNGEGMWFTDKAWEYLKKRFKRIIYFADNDSEKVDNPGIMLGNKWKDKYGVDFIHTPDNTKSDISDYYKEYGYSKTKWLLKELIC